MYFICYLQLSMHLCWDILFFFLKQTGTKYIVLLNDLDNDYAKGDNRYTTSVQDQRQMKEFWKQSYIPKKDSA